MELPDSIAVAAGLAPVVRDSKQAVVAESDRGRVRRITSGAADYTHRQPIQLASGQSSVARSIELLVGDLLFGRRVVAAVAGVDQLITEVLVVDVAARDHDGVGTFSTVSRDAPHQWPVYPRLAKSRPGGEGRTNGIARNLAKELRHDVSVPRANPHSWYIRGPAP